MGRFDLARGKAPEPEQKSYVMTVEEEIDFLMLAHRKAIEGLAGTSLKNEEKKFEEQVKIMVDSKQISERAYKAICIIYHYHVKPEEPIRPIRERSVSQGYSRSSC
jgi:hypothetical protein